MLKYTRVYSSLISHNHTQLEMSVLTLVVRDIKIAKFTAITGDIILPNKHHNKYLYHSK